MLHLRLRAGIAQSVLLLATCWTVRGLNSGAGEIFHARPARPWSPPSFLYNGYQVSLPRVKGPGRGVNHPPPSRAEVKESVELYIYSHLWVFMICSRANFTLLFHLCLNARSFTDVTLILATQGHISNIFPCNGSPVYKQRCNVSNPHYTFQINSNHHPASCPRDNQASSPEIKTDRAVLHSQHITFKYIFISPS